MEATLAAPSANIATSKLAMSERWLKLYRKIHNLFIKDELVHVGDLQVMLQDINAKIAMLNTKLDANLTNLKAQLDSHTHIAPQAPTGTLPTTPPVVPTIVDLTPITPTPYTNAIMVQTDEMYRLMPTAIAPMADGASVESVAASSEAISNIGL